MMMKLLDGPHAGACFVSTLSDINPGKVFQLKSEAGESTTSRQAAFRFYETEYRLLRVQKNGRLVARVVGRFEPISRGPDKLPKWEWCADYTQLRGRTIFRIEICGEK